MGDLLAKLERHRRRNLDHRLFSPSVYHELRLSADCDQAPRAYRYASERIIESVEPHNGDAIMLTNTNLSVRLPMSYTFERVKFRMIMRRNKETCTARRLHS
jgi:hypothetical protein